MSLIPADFFERKNLEIQLFWKGVQNMGKNVFAALLLALPLAIGGCAQTQEAAKTKTAKGAAIGAAAGAVTGAIVGHQTGHKGTGAVVGGLAGAAVGGAIGYQLDKQEKELEEVKNAQVTRKEDRLIVTMRDAILFDTDSAVLQPGAVDSLNQMADVMIRYPENDIIVKGHTDSKGSEAYNQELSQKRATAVKDHLVSRGVTVQRITAQGLGETRPVATNETPEGRQQNRRVEIEIIPQPEQPQPQQQG
jgi:outer membrane protein OmpA-like peptidoglycan-associated protein